MKTDKFADLHIGDRYDEGEYHKAICDDLQTLKYVLTALIDQVTLISGENRDLDLRRHLRDRLEEK